MENQYIWQLIVVFPMNNCNNGHQWGVYPIWRHTHRMDCWIMWDREPGDYLRLLMHRAQTTCKTGGLSSNPALCHWFCAILLKLCSQYFTKYLTQYLITYLTKYLTMIFFCIFSHTERWSMVSKPLGGRCCYSQVKAQCWTLRTTLKSDDLQVFFRGFPKLCQFVPGSLPEWMAIAKQMQHLRITQMLFFHQMVATNRLPATCFKHPTKCGGQNNCSAFGKVWTLPDWHVLQLVSYWRVDRSWNPTLQSDWKLEMRLQERFDRTLYPQLAR